MQAHIDAEKIQNGKGGHLKHGAPCAPIQDYNIIKTHIGFLQKPPEERQVIGFVQKTVSEKGWVQKGMSEERPSAKV